LFLTRELLLKARLPSLTAIRVFLSYLRSAEKVTTCFAAASCDRKYAGGLHGKGAKGSKNLAD